MAAGAAAAGPATVAALGDSLTQGYGLPPEQGLVPQLERWLSDRGADVRLVNAGVSGDTTAGGLARVGWTLTPDVSGLVVILGANDMLRGLDPGEARANLAGILEAAREAGVETLLVGLPAFANFGPEYADAFDAIYPDLAARFGTLHAPDLFAPLRSADGPVLDYFQADRLHPNAEGTALIAAGLGPSVLDLLERIGN